MTYDELTWWIGVYEAVWRSGEGLDRLFAPDARYYSSPYMKPYVGLAAIEEFWKRETDEGEEFSLHSGIVAIDGDVGVVRVKVEYFAPKERNYRDLWIVTLDADGSLCTEFEEWPFWPPGSEGGYAPGPA